MAAESGTFAELTDEFALLPETAAESGVTAAALPRVRRSWVNVPAGGHVSAVFWGDGPPELVLLHDIGGSARSWDAVAAAVGRPLVAVDLPGHGRSDWRRDGRYEPGRLAPSVAEAVRSFAPRASLVAGAGLGADTALALHRRSPLLVPALALVGTLPGGRAARWPGPERFPSRGDALAALAARRPGAGDGVLRREVLHELLQQADGSWAWRHHPGSQPPALPPGDDGAAAADALWDELAGLGRAAALIGDDQTVRAASQAGLGERAPETAVITVPGGADIVTAQPAAVAGALRRLLAGRAPAS